MRKERLNVFSPRLKEIIAVFRMHFKRMGAKTRE